MGQGGGHWRTCHAAARIRLRYLTCHLLLACQQKYINPSQRDVTVILAALVQVGRAGSRGGWRCAHR